MNFKNSNYALKLFPSCKINNGVSRSIIIDLDRHKFHLIPNALYEIINKFSSKPFKAIYNNFKEHHSVLDSYFKFLLDNELIVLNNDSEIHFEEISEKWETPRVLENFIIDIDEGSNFNFKKIFAELSQLKCHTIQLRFLYTPDFEMLKNVISTLEKLHIISVELVLKYQKSLYSKRIEICKLNARVTNLLFYSSDCLKVENFQLVKIVKVKDSFINEKSCGTFSPDFFSIGIYSYNESKKFNNCLNGKLSIDRNGEIRNCPSVKISLGHINDISLIKVMNLKLTKKYWDIDKSKISTCKECEFRFICTDCRAYVENPNDVYSKPLKCGYDPKTTIWSDWSKNPLKQKAIQVYELEEVV